MADWKQITARIRRARTSKDPAGQLTNLFSKTRDAMVAFELARYFESSGNSADAGKWYLTAAQRFRRSDWKTKAEESAARLGATEPAEIPAPAVKSESAASPEPPTAESPAPEVEHTEAVSGSTDLEAQPAPQSSRPSPPSRQRRGRRGGRDQRPSRRSQQSASSRETRPSSAPPPAQVVSEEPAEQPTAPSAFLETVSEAPAPSLRGRYGDPGLASRLTQLEMNFRRLLVCPPVKIQEADAAPAGPGVWLLTDSDQTTYYYVEACQTLRVAIPNLLRGGAARRGGGESIKPQLAEHLGIPESRVSKYLSDHCVVRWLQMDEGASHFAHFLIAVLRPTLNE
jgi:hypothetical protein